ncbi:MAG: hypothetical protein M1812_000169 [Candelaria pacifica]|nr:MAG: hypothetical protein M1812_000169 [Candelaria pacifica]
MSVASSKISLSHEERTAQEPREEAIHSVILSEISQESQTIRRLRLSIPKGENIKFLPGQWLDVHVPGLRRAGGFTITSIPSVAESKATYNGFIELAVQWSPRNPPAAWLWQSEKDIVGTALKVRVGGSFVWPPPSVDVGSIKRVVFVAGGVGINPLISILSDMHAKKQMPEHVHFLYTLKDPKPEEPTSVERNILFLSRLEKIRRSIPHNQMLLKTFLTGNRSKLDNEFDSGPEVLGRRIKPSDLIATLGNEKDRGQILCYVCGPAAMTDEFVKILKEARGMDPGKVLCEKWW